MFQINEEYQYLNLIQSIITNGTIENNRNGNTKSIFGNMMRFSLKDNKIPILTTKKVAWKTCLKELLWFIKGETDNNILNQQNVHIWDANASPEFVSTRNLSHYRNGLLGPIYGYQWRNYNAPYDYINSGHPFDPIMDKYDETYDYSENLQSMGIDQLQYIIDNLKNPHTRNSRRLIMTAWNPLQLDEMVLPPCHILCQFNVHDGNKLSCAMYQRSVDVMLGCPFNIASYSFLTHLLAKHCNLEAHEFVYFMGNCHIYEEHLLSAPIQLSRQPYEFPTLEINCIKENINDYNINDFIIHNYSFHDTIKMNMIA
jgi:thymidylate synthase